MDDTSQEEYMTLDEITNNNDNCPLWTSEGRMTINPPSDHELNERKKESGELKPVLPMEANTTIPMIVIKSDEQQKQQPNYNRIDLILSCKHSFIMWKPLVFSGARPGGINELHKLHFELGIPCFPMDYPDAWEAYKSWTIDYLGQEAKEKYDNRPIGKRPNIAYKDLQERLGLNPFAPDFEKLLASSFSSKTTTSPIPSADFLKMWVLRGSWVQGWIEDILGSDSPSKELAEERLKQRFQHASLDNAFLCIRLTSLGKGSMDRNALIYSCLEDIDLTEQPKQSDELPDLQNYEAKDDDEEMDHNMTLKTTTCMPIPKDPNRLIGFATTGGYNFSVGTNSAIAYIRASVIFDSSFDLNHLWYRLPHCLDQVRLAKYELLTL